MPKYSTPALQYKTEYLSKKLKGQKDVSDLDVMIVDGMPGMGKTSAMINYINSSPEDVHFVYVTPYLDEVNRIIKECPNKKFKQPTSNNKEGSKFSSFEKLLAKKNNIVTTHALLHMIGQNVLKLFTANNYILILDEVPNVVDFVAIPNEVDIETLFSKHAKLEENGRVVWTDVNYENTGKGFFSDIKHQCEIGELYYYPTTKKFMVWTFPIGIFNSFTKNFVITYMFDGQIQSAYYKMHNVKYKYVYVKRKANNKGEEYSTKQFEFIDALYDNPQPVDCSKYKELIHLNPHTPLDDIGSENVKKKTDLCANWYKKAAIDPLQLNMTVLKNNTYNYFRHVVESKSDENMWTTFKNYKATLSGNGYTKGFVSCSARATNAYRDKKNLAYLINRFPDPNITIFFNKFNVEIDLDKFALSELIQWVFRSCIRDGKEINLYIPSLRMRELLLAWMNNEMNDSTVFDNKQHETYQNYQEGLDELVKEFDEAQKEVAFLEQFDMEY